MWHAQVAVGVAWRRRAGGVQYCRSKRPARKEKKRSYAIRGVFIKEVGPGTGQRKEHGNHFGVLSAWAKSQQQLIV